MFISRCLAFYILTTFSFLTLCNAESTFLTTQQSTTSSLHRFDGEQETFAQIDGASFSFRGIKVQDNSLLVADFATDQIRRYGFNGGELPVFSAFTEASFIETDSSGRVYVTSGNRGAAVAARFDSQGNIEQTFVSPTGDHFLGIDADANGNVYISTLIDDASNEIQQFSADGTFLGRTLVTDNPSDISIDEDTGRLFLAQTITLTNGIQIYDVSGSAPDFSNDIATPQNSIILGVDYSTQLGTVFATDIGFLTGGGRGFQLGTDGTLLATYTPAGFNLAFDIAGIPEPSTMTLLILLGVLLSNWFSRWR